MTRPSVHLDLRELGLHPGNEEERVFDLEIAPVYLGGVPFPVVLQGAGVAIRVRRIAGGYLVGVTMRATVYGPCSRCLDDVAVGISAEQEEFVPSRPEDWEEGDVSPFIEDFVVDVAGLAREALVLALPTKVLCDESCAGLCPACGAAVDSSGCACSARVVDERWAGLAHVDFSEGRED
ncbi:MAG: YceD family protein [Thermoleophilia bacterium]